MSGLEILISGAGVAGPVLAHFLSQAGAKVTIVERASSLRTGGQNVDIRGLGLKILNKMGTGEAVRNKTTQEEGVAFVDAANRRMAAFPVDKSGKNLSMTAEIEIMRGDLALIMYDATKNDVEYQFDDHIDGLDEIGNKTKVHFRSGLEREFDPVIAADGLGSSTRNLVLVICLYHYLDNMSPGLASYAQSTMAPGLIVGTTDSLTRASIWICSTSEKLKSYSKLSMQQQKALMHEIFDDAGGEAVRVLAGMDKAEDFYMQEVAQVKVDSWSKGRVALVGDAAFCPSPISGMGTTLAIHGAYVLAGEIIKNPHDPAQAFGTYEDVVRTFVVKGQKLFPGAPQMTNPDTAWGIRILHAILGFVSWYGILTFFGSRAGPPVDAFTLPEYEFTK